MATARKPLGPRVTVQFGTRKAKGSAKAGPIYIYMLKSTAEMFGFKAVQNPVVKSKKGYDVPVRGSIGAGSIKVKQAGQKQATKKGQGTKYRRIPVPVSANITQIRKFLQGATKNKPTEFVSPDGRTHPVGTGK